LYEIVGVVRGVRYSLDAEVRPRVYLPFHQAALPATSLGFVVGPSAPDPARLMPAVRAATARVDAAQPLADARPYDEVLSSSIQGQRFQTVLIGAFGFVALMLGFVGVYGVVSYHVTQHVREIGVRMAMGAGRGRVVRAVVWDTLRPVLLGAGVGLVLAVVSARAMSDVTTLVGRTDLPMLVAVMALLIGVAGVAAWLPARRAARIDPVLALRGE
jgi:ABC-type lipoprotein release transport system permease subunit